MSEAQTIQFFKNEQIDKTKWDECIRQSDNGLIYAYSFYLDLMAKNWDALILGDYEKVMPLTWKNKFGIQYLYQPFLTAQLGIFGKKITNEDCAQFLKSIPEGFRYADIMLNYKNTFHIDKKFISERKNLVLSLHQDYEIIKQNFNENTKRNIKKATVTGYIFKKNFDVSKVIELAILQMKKQGTQAKDDMNNFRKLHELLHKMDMSNTYGIFSSSDDLLSSCVFFFSHNRAYYILVGNNPKGRDIGASHALINEFIKEQAGKNILLDFEGSDISTLANFYKGFGAVNESYLHLKINKLPFFLKWLKR